MDNKTYATAVGETTAKLYFEKQGYFVYTNSTGKSEFDLVLSKDKDLYAVEIKTVSVPKIRVDGSVFYEVQLKSVRANNKENTLKYFDSTFLDYLVIVDITDFTILVLKAQDIKAKSTMRVNKADFL